ncbi:hypothetical protein ACQKLP_09730 [Chitinophaga sp. NPDC101104]|uniref:hypothetical protein n=1 Tax=Chitinophaga sp. NPDC101104 TaxID=3390561 RepID=UPI003CFEE537
MKTENYTVKIQFDGRQWDVPVRVLSGGLGRKITVVLQGLEICYERDEHDGLRAINHLEDFNPELLYQIGKGIQEQCI